MDSIWGDAMVFRPERWLEPLPPQDILLRGWGNTLAFSDGPRNCIGYRLGACCLIDGCTLIDDSMAAIFQFKVILATVIRAFRFTVTPAEIRNKVASSMQPYVVGEVDRGPQIPLQVSFA